MYLQDGDACLQSVIGNSALALIGVAS